MFPDKNIILYDNMLSTTKTSTDKSVQGELVHTESKDTSIIIKKLMHTTAVSHENFQTKNEKFGMKIEQKDLKETGKQETPQTKNEKFEMKVEQKDLKETGKQETPQTKNEKFEIKLEQKDLKETEQETPRLLNEQSKVSKPEQQQMKSKIPEMKHVELRTEKLKKEDKESKCSINVNQTDIPKCKMIPIADKFVSFDHT